MLKAAADHVLIKLIKLLLAYGNHHPTKTRRKRMGKGA